MVEMAESNSKDKNQGEKCACAKRFNAIEKAIKDMQREIEILKKVKK